MPHYSVPAHRHNDIASIRLSTRPALTLSIPTADVPEPPRPQYDTMRSYQRLEKAGTIASMESQQKNVRPLFAYPRKDHETPWKKNARKAAQREEEKEEQDDTLPFLSSSLIDTSDLLDSIFSSSPKAEEFFASSPPTSIDFSSSLPYPSERTSERKVWGRDPPPVELSARKDISSSSTSSKPISIDPRDYDLPMSSTLSYHPPQDLWKSSPPTTTSTKGRSPKEHHRRKSSTPHLQSSLPPFPYTIIPDNLYNNPTQSSTSFQDFASRHRQRRTSQRMTTPSPAMRYVTVLEDISEDEQQPVLESVEVELPYRVSRRSRLGVKIERAVAWVLRR